MDIRNSGIFICKKWTLVTFSSISIVGTIILACLATTLVDHIYFSTTFYTQSEISYEKTVCKNLIYVGSFFAILFDLVGLVGAYKEHYCMSATYSVLMTLNALGSVYLSVAIDSIVWVFCVLNFIVCIVSYAYLHDLRQIRLLTFATPIYVTQPAQQQTIVHIPGQSYVPGYQTQPQQNWQYQPQMQNETQQQSSGWQSSPPPPPPPYSVESKENFTQNLI